MDMLLILHLCGTCLIGPPNEGTWVFTASSSGDNYIWTSPTPIAADGSSYEMLYTIQSASVMVSYIGISFGPEDVMDMLPEDVIETWRPANGPTHLDFGWVEVIAPEDIDPPSIAYDWIIELNEKGYVSYRMENLFLGQAVYNIGWPWGSVIVQVESGTIVGQVHVIKVPPPCYADVTGDGVVDVSDLLDVISQWGYCFECSGDVNFDSYIDVTDLLAIVGYWGQCPK